MAKRKLEKIKEEHKKEEESDKQDLNSMKTSNKRNKKHQSIESEIMIDMKAARKSRQREKCLSHI